MSSDENFDNLQNSSCNVSDQTIKFNRWWMQLILVCPRHSFGFLVVLSFIMHFVFNLEIHGDTF